MNYIRKQYKNIEKYAKPGHVLVIYGPRQAGKTTMLKDYFDMYTRKKLWLQGDDLQLQIELKSRTIGRITPILKDYELIIIDEAQYIEDVGMTLKFMVDKYKDKTFIVTGSSAFGLLHHTKEPLTGRASYINLYPFDAGEIENNNDRIFTLGSLSNLLVYGSFPQVFQEGDKKEKERMARALADSYMYKDVLEFDGIRNYEGVRNILKLLAMQIGHDVSINEIANKVNLARATVTNYLDILEKSFIIKSSISVNTKNIRNEIGKNKRYYFVDQGIRNALIDNFAGIENRFDIGALWENFIFMERVKKHAHTNDFINMCFWRTYEGQEIDILEAKDGKYEAIECKWNESKIKDGLRIKFIERFGGDINLKIINKENWGEII